MSVPTVLEKIIARKFEEVAERSRQVGLSDLEQRARLADPVRGREEPDLLGWTSDAAYSLVPASSTCVEAPNAGRGRFATIFLLDGNAVVDTAASRFNETLRKGRVLWSDAQGKHQLSIELGAPGQVEVSLEEIA